ncbi:MAG TPA: T9SS type A sorting domain-containing protein [Bacteroidia bacterium]|nr:T9SS type A sorting domain-containing protein [Bacteroidia bacterium]
MKKIIVIVLMLVLVYSEKSLAAWAVSGAATVCANGSNNNTYTLTGNPTGTTITNIQWHTTLGSLSNNVVPNVTVTWYDQCPTTGTLIVDWVEYRDNDDQQLHLESFPFGGAKSITVKGLGTPAPSPAWNCTPYKCSTSNITYSISPSCGATNYQWQIPVGWTPQTLLSGPNQSSITLTPNATGGGVVSVTVSNTSGGCNLNKTYSCTVTRPIQPPVFTTTQTVYCLSQQSTAQFCVNAVPGAIDYTWTLPAGYTIIGPTNGTCITVDFHNLTQTGQLCCRTNISCGGSSANTCLTVTSTANPQFAVDIVPHPGHCDYVLKAYTYTPKITLYTWKYKKTTAGTYTTKTTAIDQCNTCLLQASSSYNYIVTLTNECGATGSQTGIINTPPPCWLRESNTSVSEDLAEQKIFPNPAAEYFNIRFIAEDAQNLNLEIIDVRGRIVIKNKMATVEGENKITVNTSKLTNGIYSVLLKGNSVKLRERLIIAR